MNTPIGIYDTLSTKADLAGMEGSLKEEFGKIHAALVKMDKKFTVYFSVLIFTVIFVSRNTLEFLARLVA